MKTTYLFTQKKKSYAREKRNVERKSVYHYVCIKTKTKRRNVEFFVPLKNVDCIRSRIIMIWRQTIFVEINKMQSRRKKARLICAIHVMSFLLVQTTLWFYFFCACNRNLNWFKELLDISVFLSLNWDKTISFSLPLPRILTLLLFIELLFST